MADKIFVVPVETISESDIEGVKPKYSDRDGVDSWSGQIINFKSDWSIPLEGEYYIVRFYGDSFELEAIESKDDAHTRQEYDISKSEVAKWFNNHFDQNRTFDDWLDAFGVDN